MKAVGLKNKHFGIFLYARQFAKYKQYYIAPGISLEMLRYEDLRIDLELKLLCFGLGIRVIILNKKNK